MSASASAYLIAGVSTIGLFDCEVEDRTRKRFHPDSGEEYDFEYKQYVIKFMGQEIEPKRKEFFSRSEYSLSRSGDNAEYGYKMSGEMHDWCFCNGFCYHFLRFHHYPGHQPGQIEGVLGICCLDYDHTDPSNYGWGWGMGKEVPIKACLERLEQVKKLLLKVGCEKDPALFVMSHLS